MDAIEWFNAAPRKEEMIHAMRDGLPVPSNPTLQMTREKLRARIRALGQQLIDAAVEADDAE